MSTLKSKFTLKPSALSQHTANFNKILEQVPTPKIEPIELVKPVENINPNDSNQENSKTVVALDEKEFVFGEQLTDRVICQAGTSSVTSTTSNGVENSNGTTEVSKTTGSASLESSNAHDSSENDMYTLLRLNCKLYVLETDKQNWSERGYGVVKLIETTDRNNCKIMMWTDKCFRLILNTKMFEKMQIDRANKKSIRFNAFDNGTIRIFLIKTSNPNDCDELYDLMKMRLMQYNCSLAADKSSSSQTSKHKKKIVFQCNCKFYELEEEQNESKHKEAQLQLYTFESESPSEYSSQESQNHQLLLDILDLDENNIYFSTYLKLIKPLSSNKQQFELDDSIVSSYSHELIKNQSHFKYRIILSDKECLHEFLDLYKKEPIIERNEDDLSSNGDEQEEEEEEEDINRKSDSTLDSERFNATTEDESSQISQSKETGEFASNRKRKNEESDAHQNNANFKKQEIQQDINTNKRNIEEESSVEESNIKKSK